MIPREAITGLVLAGGRGSRMGGVDKGLQPFHGLPLAAHALRRLAPQVGPLMISANRHPEAYAAFGVPVWPDASDDYLGPLAGILSGLRHAGTPWLATVACDSPRFPTNLVTQLATAAEREDAEIAIAATVDEAGHRRRQPVFLLLRRHLADSLAAFLAAGERRVGLWAGQHRHVVVPFDDATAFVNANTTDELERIERGA